MVWVVVVVALVVVMVLLAAMVVILVMVVVVSVVVVVVVPVVMVVVLMVVVAVLVVVVVVSIMVLVVLVMVAVVSTVLVDLLVFTEDQGIVTNCPPPNIKISYISVFGGLGFLLQNIMTAKPLVRFGFQKHHKVYCSHRNVYREFQAQPHSAPVSPQLLQPFPNKKMTALCTLPTYTHLPINISFLTHFYTL